MAYTDPITGYKTGDLVVGSSDPSKSVYSSTGAKNSQAGVSFYGNPEELEEQSNALVSSLTRNGGKRIVTQEQTKAAKKKGSKIKANNTAAQFAFESYTPTTQQNTNKEPDEVKLQTIQFENSFGKIKAKVEYVVEHPLAFMLMFSDEDSVVFEPKTGETLTLHTADKERFSVYYPGVIFNSPPTDKKLMILFKVPEENQE
jgi:methyltransferase-like protein